VTCAESCRLPKLTSEDFQWPSTRNRRWSQAGPDRVPTPWATL